VVSSLPPPQRDPREVGHAEIQAAAPPPRQGAQVPGRRRPTSARTVCALAARRAPRRLDDGSPVSREVHAGFCERRGARLPPATHLRRLVASEYPCVCCSL